MGLKSTKILIAEHRAVQQVLDELEGLLDDFVTKREVADESLEKLEGIAAFLSRDLVLHIQKEEEGLFPYLEAFFPAGVGPIAVMRNEHEIVNEAWAGLREGISGLRRDRSIEGEGARRAASNGRLLIDALRDHLYKEEQVLFPFADSRLGEREDSEVLRKFEEFEAQFVTATAGTPNH